MSLFLQLNMAASDIIDHRIGGCGPAGPRVSVGSLPERNASADKTPKPELVHIKGATLTRRHRRSFFVLSLAVHRGFYLLIINGPGVFTPRHHCVWAAAQQEVVRR